MGIRILHLSPYYAPSYVFGGVVRALEGLAEAQVSAGHSVRVLTCDSVSPVASLRLRRKEVRNGVEIYRVMNRWPKLRKMANLSSPRGMNRWMNELLPETDVIHCHEFRTLENWILARRLKSMRERVPVVLSPHGTLPHETGRRTAKALWDAILGNSLAPMFDHVVCLSTAERDDLQLRWRALQLVTPPATIVPNGINPDIFAGVDRAALRANFRQRYNLMNVPTLLYLGRLHRRKGVTLLARAFMKLKENNARLLIAGPDEGEASKLQKMADERIILLGYLQGEERLAALAAADGFALPAIGEGLSMALLEAMAAGLPAIITPGCNLPQVVERSAGWLVAPEVGSITKGISDWLAAKAHWPQMAAAGQQLVNEEFCWPNIEPSLTAVYRDLIARISSAARS